MTNKLKATHQTIFIDARIDESFDTRFHAQQVSLEEEFALRVTLFEKCYREFMISLYTILKLGDRNLSYNYVIKLDLKRNSWDIYVFRFIPELAEISFFVDNDEANFHGISFRSIDEVEDFVQRIKTRSDQGDKQAVLNEINIMIYKRDLYVTDKLHRNNDDSLKIENTTRLGLREISVNIVRHPEISKVTSINKKIGPLFQQFFKEMKFESKSVGLQNYFDWLFNYSIEFPTMPRVLNYLYTSRKDLQRAFPNNAKEFEILILEWFIDYGYLELGLDEISYEKYFILYKKRIESIKNVLSKKKSWKLKMGNKSEESINVVAYFDCILGLSQAAKNYEIAFKDISIKWNKILRPPTASPKLELLTESDFMSSDINLVIANGDQMRNVDMLMPNYWKYGKKTIGIWSWELESINNEYLSGAKYLDEIWFISEFAQNSMKKFLDKVNIVSKVVNIPIIVNKLDNKITNNIDELVSEFFKRNKLSTKNYFFFNLDFLSDIQRKNPRDLIELFKIVKAKKSCKNLKLVIKTINGNLRPEALKDLKMSANNNESILIFDETWDRDFLDAVICNSKMYISLHRAEGFGMGMAEAMARGIPVLATNYGGNLDFMSTSNSLLIDYRLEKIVETENKSYFDSGGRWATPNMDDAVDKLTFALENESALGGLAVAGQETILNKLSSQSISRKILKLL
jgi:glycosyltransferase involved in cell wall biosynthesis